MDERPHFSIFGVPVRVRASFAVTLLFGWDGSVGGALAWAVIVFVSVLAHELGHALLGRAFGLTPSVEIYAFGGQTGWIGGKNISSGKSFLISLAGPTVSVLLCVLGFVVALAIPKSPLQTFWIVNGFWAAFNLLPIIPLDGGNALRSLLLAVGLRRPAEIGTRVLGVALGAPLCALAAYASIPFLAMFLGLFVISNVQSLVRYMRAEKDQTIYDELRAHYPDWVRTKDGKSMIDAGLRARREATTDFLRAYATEVLAMGQCLDGDARSALATLEGSMPKGMLPGLPIYLHVLFEAGEGERATALAREAMEQGDDEQKQQAAAALASRQPSYGTA